MRELKARRTVPMSAYRFFTTQKLGDTTVARAVDTYLQGVTLAEMVKLELLQIVDSDEAQSLVLDLQDVKMISSSVMGTRLTFINAVVLSPPPHPVTNRIDSIIVAKGVISFIFNPG